MNRFYITTAIPYVNAKPHVGHALEFIQADVITRFNKLKGNDTSLLSGSDENALKNVQAAEKENITPLQLVDKNSRLFENLLKRLNIKYDIFQRGSDPQHHKSSQRLWKDCQKDIYKKTYSGMYCVGCEQFYETHELNDKAECLEHPGKKLDKVSEENYFFRLSKYQDKLIQTIQSDEYKITPLVRKNEMLSFLKEPLRDISISRSNERAKNWGVAVPDDDSQRMYVWFDALNIYRSGVEDKDLWPADLHVIGKGILRFHAVYWPAFLLSAGLELPKELFVHEYITVNGQKMSKTIGNVLDPIPLIEKYGVDALRYYMLSKISPFSDGDFSEEKFKEVYNADLANGLGNLVARVAKLCEKVDLHLQFEPKISEEYKNNLKNFKFNEVLEDIWIEIKKLDQQINTKEPWKITDKEKLKQVLSDSVKEILSIANELTSFLPETAEKIERQFKGPKITSQKPLFPRIT
jgi:methionyl-tRNA synthetase